MAKPMPLNIRALPASTAHLLNSAQILLSPASATKELVDNALDAHASSVSVEVSPNTLDVIQVRDNGHGIPPNDRELLGGKHCTSKIRKFEDVNEVNTLGFRGEALHALAAIAGKVRCETRCEGEMVGRRWLLGRWNDG
jgi:DNA mismatch repair protein MutL